MLESRVGQPPNRARSGVGARLLASFIFATCLLAAGNSHAQERDELARRHFESGEAYFAEADYTEALKAFWKAYELSNRPEILLSVAVVEERLGHLQAAVDALDRHLAESPDSGNAEAVRLRRSRLHARLQEQRAAQAPAATAGGAPDTTRGPGEPPADRAPEAADRTGAYIAFSVGALAAVGAALTGLGAQVEYNELQTACARSSCDDEDIRVGKDLAVASSVLTGVSLLSVGVGVVLWVTAPESSAALQSQALHTARSVTSAEPRLQLALSPTGPYAQAGWRF